MTHPRVSHAAAVLLVALSACDGAAPSALSEIDQEVNSICELAPEQMRFCAFPNASANGFGCYCDRDLCLDLMAQCEPDPKWTQFCFSTCLQEAEPPPPFNPSEDCEEMLDSQSLPRWHICHYPRCWDLEPGETCIVPLGGGGFES